MTGRSEVRAWIGLGGNLGDPAAAMAQALQRIDADPHCGVLAVSDIYRTPPWGVTDQPDFLNACATVMTTLEARQLLDLLLSLERTLHRVRGRRWGPRTIDLDILAYGNRQIEEEGLTVPHPRMTGRAFVMVPLAEIAPDLLIGEDTVARHAQRLAGEPVTPLNAGKDWWRTALPAG